MKTKHIKMIKWLWIQPVNWAVSFAHPKMNNEKKKNNRAANKLKLMNFKMRKTQKVSKMNRNAFVLICTGSHTQPHTKETSKLWIAFIWQWNTEKKSKKNKKTMKKTMSFIFTEHIFHFSIVPPLPWKKVSRHQTKFI